jgi:hypothetical protein
MKHFLTRPDGTTVTWDTPDVPVALDGLPVLAALLAATGVINLTDAANVAGVTEQALVDEVLGWGAAAAGLTGDPVDDVEVE